MSSNVEEDDCPICLNPLTAGAVLRTECGHLFHKKCLDQLEENGFDICPICRASLVVAKVINNNNPIVNEIRHVSEEEREEERRLIRLGSKIITEVPGINNDALALILLGARGQTHINTVDEALKILYESPDASPDASPVASPDASPVARRRTRTVTKPKANKRDPKRVAGILKKWKEANSKKPGGKKLKKKGQRTHRRKKNTSRSL